MVRDTPVVDAGVDGGSGRDGGVDAGVSEAPAAFLFQTAASGSSASANYKLRVGVAAPSGTASSAHAKVVIGPAAVRR